MCAKVLKNFLLFLFYKIKCNQKAKKNNRHKKRTILFVLSKKMFNFEHNKTIY